MKKVVITGAGCVTPIGNNLNDFAKSLLDGRLGSGTITKFNTTKFPVREACELKGYAPSASFQVLDPFIQYGLTATEEALKHSGADLSKMDPYRIGVTVSSSKGGFTTFEKFAERLRKRPSAILGARVYANLIPNMLSQWIARRLELHGPAKPVVAACATGIFAVIEGIRMIEDDEADLCIAGASDASITPLLLAGYHKLGVLSQKGIHPFDKNRSGFLIGEGAGVLILESEEHAKARKANILGNILAYDFGNESAHAINFPLNGTGLEACLKRLVKKAGILPREIDALQLHGTATGAGDIYETLQLKRAFGKEAYQISGSAAKSMTGHAVGASGAFSLIASLISLRDQFIPPTIGLKIADPECDLDYTPNIAKKKKIKISGAIAMGFGGHIASILVGK